MALSETYHAWRIPERLRVCLEWALPVGLFLVVILSNPWSDPTGTLLKGPVTSVVAGLLMIGASIRIWMHMHVESALRVVALLWILGFFVVGVSSWGQFNFETLFGTSLETGSLVSFLVLLSGFSIAYLMGHTKECQRRVQGGIIYAGVAVGAAVLVAGLTGFEGLMMLAGGWLSTHLLLGLALLASASLYLAKEGTINLAVLVFIVSTFLISKPPFVILASICVLLLVLFVHVYVAHKNRIAHSQLIILLLGLILSTSLLWSAGSISIAGMPALQVPEQEIRPSLPSTLHVVYATFQENESAIWKGVGIHEFDAQWLKHKPQEVLMSDFWNSDFPMGSSLFLMFLLFFGLPAVIVLTVLILTLLLKGFFALWTDRECKEHSTSAFLWMSAVYVCIWTVLFIPSVALLFLAGVVWGIYSAFFFGGTQERPVNPYFRVGSVVYVSAIGLGLLIVGVWFLFVLSHVTFLSNTESLDHDMAIHRLHISTTYMDSPYLWYMYGLVLQDSLRSQIDKFSQQDVSPEERTDLLTLADTTVDTTGKAALLDPENYLYVLEAGNASVMRGLITLSDEDLEAGLRGYQFARTLASEHPLPHFSEAQALFFLGRFDDARQSLEAALKLKPNFEDALLLLERVEAQR